ncbi:unnamed protein product [Closterium sp. Naga37s-1]|nr:unnamed protein product [Closterium sp. Naga37s-1]
MKLRGSLHADISRLTALTSLNVAPNLLDARMSEWALPLTGLKALKQLSLNYNWFSDPLLSFLLTMSSLSTLNVKFNYLAGPIIGTPYASLKSLNIASNLLTGTFPASSITACDARSNCLEDSLKAVLGVPLTNWGVSSLCKVVLVVSGVSSSSPGPRDLGDVLCSPAGVVVEINLNTRQLAGSMHADISKLIALTALVFHSNLLAGCLDAFTAPFTSLSKLENIQLHYNYLFGPIPSALISLKSLSKL